MKFILPLCLLFCGFFTTALHAQKKVKTHYLSQTLNPDEIKSLGTKIDKVYYMFLGHFSNKTQADTSSTGLFKEQEIICVPIWKKRNGEYWMYMSWYPADNIESPMSQLVYKISKHERDTFLLERFNLPENMRGLVWADAKAFDKFTPHDLIASGCINYLLVDGENFYSKPRTETEYCPEIAGAPFAFLQTEGLVTTSKITLYGTFFDANKNVIFTQKPGGVHFERRDKNNPKYLDILYKKKGKKK